MVTIPGSLQSRITLNDGVSMPMYGLGTYQCLNQDVAPICTYALQQGYRLIDNATLYGNQKYIGQAIKKCGLKREDVFYVSKVWENGYDLCCQEIKQCLESTGLGYIDLYLIHSPSNGPVLETFKAMLEHKEKGLIRSCGVSNFGVHHLKEMEKAGCPLPSTNQVELHPWQRREELVDYCRQKGIAVMGYSPLTKGKFIDDPVLKPMAEKYEKTAGQILLRWSVQKGYITIPKSSKPERVLENADVFTWSLSQDDMNILDSVPEKSCTGGWNPCVSPWNG